MGVIFGNLLRKHREALGISGNGLCTLSGIDGGNLRGVESGKRPPSGAFQKALLDTPELHLDHETLMLWIDLDKLGEDGLERVRRYLAASPASTRPHPC